MKKLSTVKWHRAIEGIAKYARQPKKWEAKNTNDKTNKKNSVVFSLQANYTD
jgi:hypothetical protein